ncbi:MAG: cation:proton antiporter [Candidatus Pacebacteria bacterium]|nr:cation:proton antiporter [Candidatus Paceibacterota bacterium]
MQGFQELTLIILIVSVVSIFIHYIKQPLVIGYIISGIIAGPYVFNIITASSGIELFSKLGIIILLFTIGLNLDPNTMKEVGRDSILGGLLQVVFSSMFGFLLSFYILHFSFLTSVFIGLALALSSTIIVLKILSDKGQIDKLHGKISVGILLLQDILSAVILIVLSIFRKDTPVVAMGGESMIIVTFIVKIIILIIIYMLLRNFVLKKSVALFASSQETLLLFGLGSGFLMAYIFYGFGFSLEIGALFAGVALASSNFAKEISSRLKPIQDFFIAIFFVFLGAELVVENSQNLILPIIIFSIFVVVVKLMIIFFILNLFGHRTRTSFYVAVSLTQVSEFSLIMLGLVAAQGYVDKNVVSIITIVAMITISISAYFMTYLEDIYFNVRNLFKRLEIRKNNFKIIKDEAKDLDAVVFGFDRIGHEFVDVFKKLEYKYLVIDINPKYIERAIESGAPAIYGDAEDLGFLEENNILLSKMIISTIPNFKTNLYLVENYKKKNKKGVIIVIAHDEIKSKTLYEAGANYVIMPYHLGAYHAGNMLMEFENNPEIFNLEKEIQEKRINQN